MNEELKAALEKMKSGFETKSKEQIQTEIKAFEAKHKEIIEAETKAAKEAFNAEIAELKSKFEADIKVVKDHAEKLDLKMQKNAKQIDASGKTFGDVLKDAMEEKTDDLAKFQRKETKSLVLELKAVGDMSTGNVTGGSRYGQLMSPDIIDGVSRKVHMDQILPGGSIGPGNTYTFMREKGKGEGNPAPTAEGATKPQFDFDLEEATVNIETVAGWLRVTRKAMSNIPGFISFLQRRIPERFRRVLDNQILYGTGVSPELKGILTAGNFVASTASASEPLIERLIDDISALEDTYERDANGILLRPADYYGFFKNKASGSGEYDLPQGVTFENGQMRLFGIPVYASTAVTSPDYVVGDFEMGAQLLTQEAMRIEFFEQDGTNVRDNKITIRVEGNYALPVYGGDYFIKGDSSPIPTT